jgi:phage terminase large subunit
MLTSSSKGGRKCSVELMKEENGNLVVIREVENGKYSRFNEVKCESLQSRIRKLQVQGAQSWLDDLIAISVRKNETD